MTLTVVEPSKKVNIRGPDKYALNQLDSYPDEVNDMQAVACLEC